MNGYKMPYIANKLLWRCLNNLYRNLLFLHSFKIFNYFWIEKLKAFLFWAFTIHTCMLQCFLLTLNEFMKNPFKFFVCINILHLSCFINRNEIDYIFLWKQKLKVYTINFPNKKAYTFNRFIETKKNIFLRLNQQPT